MPEKSEFGLTVMRYELTPAVAEGLKLKLGGGDRETAVLPSVGKFKAKPLPAAAPKIVKT